MRPPIGGASSGNSYQFTSRENDGTGLYFYRARYYSPTFQRFIAQDPLDFLGGGPNLYAYVRNSPVNASDPRGTLDPWTIGAGALLGGAFGAAGAYFNNPCGSWGDIAAGFAEGAIIGGLNAAWNPGLIGTVGLAVGGDLAGQLIGGGPINGQELAAAGIGAVAGAGLGLPFRSSRDEGLETVGEIISDLGGGAAGLMAANFPGGSGGGSGSSSCGCSH